MGRVCNSWGGGKKKKAFIVIKTKSFRGQKHQNDVILMRGERKNGLNRAIQRELASSSSLLVRSLIHPIRCRSNPSTAQPIEPNRTMTDWSDPIFKTMVGMATSLAHEFLH